MEPLSYRARKWAIQRLSGIRRVADQHERMNETDWDVAVVLDACRYDTLQRITNVPFGTARSPGSTTGEWLRAAESTRVFEGANIASANSQYHRYEVGEAAIHPVWETGWDDRLGTVLPEPVLERADELLVESTTNVVAHLLQPHAPYVHRIGDEWVPTFPKLHVWKLHPAGSNEGKVSPQVAMATGQLDISRALQGYRASIVSTWALVSEYVGRWVRDGHRVLVTSDHGETFGRLRDYWLYEHPAKCDITPLVRVPFEVFKRGALPERVPQTAEEKLQALGYVD